ncbi:hypothetical protein HPP92_002408 [Vanilla planifolia]|uniref:Uncharacterized protein n=1 Tax=Vanilla planifolia TaxID=51239 RepID=A0A835S696_VANPL|nr:hypothetical protein HPP92_002408 [Vanilla planifolia]
MAYTDVLSPIPKRRKGFLNSSNSGAYKLWKSICLEDARQFANSKFLKGEKSRPHLALPCSSSVLRGPAACRRRETADGSDSYDGRVDPLPPTPPSTVNYVAFGIMEGRAIRFPLAFLPGLWMVAIVLRFMAWFYIIMVVFSATSINSELLK